MAIARRIRIICSDPYATDCSTDDDESIEVNNSTNANLIVRKFSNSIPAANSRAQLQSGAGNFIGTAPNVSSPAAVDSPNPCAKKKYTGVRQRKSGRWTAEIRCPGAKKRLFLGTFNTAEEAADAYRKKRSEIDAMTSITKKQKEEKVAQEKKNEPDEHCEKFKGVRQRKSGRRTSEIRCPFTRVKKNEPDEVSEKKYKGVRQRESGRWTSEIECPFTRRKRVHLGTFNTAEEAADAYNKKRCEFDMLISHERKKVQEKVETKEVGFVLKEPENTSNEEKCKAKVETGMDSSSSPFRLSAENSTTSVLSSQGSEGRNRSICREIPDFFLPTEEEFGFGIINSRGELIGEYSRMDDDLWLCGPGDDDEYM